MDDAGIGEDEPDQAGMKEIIRQFVGDAFRIWRHPPHRSHIMRPKLTQPFRCQCCDRFGKPEPIQSVDRPRNSVQQKQFAGSRYVRMACKNLLNESTSRSRHSKNENRESRRIAEAALATHYS